MDSCAINYWSGFWWLIFPHIIHSRTKWASLSHPCSTCVLLLPCWTPISPSSPPDQQGSPPPLLRASALAVICSCPSRSVCLPVCCDLGYSSVFALYWKASRNMSTTLMIMSSIMMRNTTTLWVSGGRLQRSMVLKNPILCLLHLPEPLPRAISPLASSFSSSSVPLLLLCRLSLSSERPHHTASARPPPWPPPSPSTSADPLFRSALALASSASPATLPMQRVAPACQWRPGALSVSACANLAPWSYHPSSFAPFLLFEEKAPALSFLLLPTTLVFLPPLVSGGKSAYKPDKGTLHLTSSLSFPSSSFDLSLLLFSSLFSPHRRLHMLVCFHLSGEAVICSPSLLSSSPSILLSLPTFCYV